MKDVYRMETETSHVSYGADILFLPTHLTACSKCMSGVTHHRNTANGLLDARGKVTQSSTVRFERYSDDQEEQHQIFGSSS